jgi:O-antigen/teichoic acid export membrane protein
MGLSKPKVLQRRHSLFFKNLIAYSSASLISQGLQILQSLLVRGFLEPALMGIWNYARVIQNFAGIFDLGITSAAGRELPLLRGAGKAEEEQTVRSTACWARLGQGLFFAAGILVFGFLGNGQQEKARLGPAMVAAILIVAVSWTETLTIFCQSAQSYGALGRNMIATAFISVLFLPIAARWGGVYGMMTAAVLVAIIQAVLLTWSARAAGIRITMSCRWPIVRRLISFGLPLRLVDYPLSLLMVLDSLFVAHYGSVSQLALYATAQTLFVIASDIPARMGNVLLYRIYTLSGGNIDRSQLAGELRRYFFIQHTLFMPFVLTTLWWAVRFIVPAFLPKYASALGVAQVLLVGIYFIPSNTLIRIFWIIDKRLVALFSSNLGGLAAGFVGLLIAAKAGHLQLGWIACGIVCGYAVHFTILLCSIGRAIWGSRTAMIVGAWAMGGSIYVALLFRYLTPEANNSGGMGTLIIMTLLGWTKTQLFLAPLYILGIWKGSVFEFLPKIFPRRQVSAATVP